MSTRFFGLTGGIGSGKSTVKDMLTELGIPTLDLDEVGRDILEHQPKVLNKLVQLFGTTILNKNNTLNKKSLAAIAFQSAENTAKLNAIMQPLIQAEEELWRKRQTSNIAVIEASVLIESQAYKRMFATIVVLADTELRKQRALKRGKQNSAQLHTIMNIQCTDETRLDIADHVINNNGSLELLHSNVQTLISNITG